MEDFMETKKFETISGVEMKQVYTPADVVDDKYDEKLGMPSQYPFTRGITEQMYRDNLWIMGQYSGFSTPEEANKRYRYLIEQGQTGFSIALDLPTQMGHDSDSRMAEGEVGKVGVSINSLADIETLFEGIDLKKVRQIRTTANANSLIMMAMYVAFAKKNGIDPNDIKFFLQNDVLKEYFTRGAFIFPPQYGVKMSVDVIEYCAKHMPSWTPLAICGYHIRDGGATAAQEIAFAISDGLCYLDAAVKRGVDIDKFYWFMKEAEDAKDSSDDTKEEISSTVETDNTYIEEVDTSKLTFAKTCDNVAFYKDEDVCLVGDANTALQYVLLLSNYCKHVYLYTLFDKFFADKILVDRVHTKKNVIIKQCKSLKEIIGKDHLEKLVFTDTKTKKDEELVVKGLFIAIGQVPQNDIFKDLVELNKGFIVVNNKMETKTPGVFAVGDCTDKNMRQVVTAVNDGSIAAFFTNSYLETNNK